MTAYVCPHDGAALAADSFAGLTVHVCGCGGHFVEKGRFRALIDEAGFDIVAVHEALPDEPWVRTLDVHYVPCPVCRKLMNRRAFGRVSGIVLDLCGDHGVWFDRGELRGVLDFVLLGGLERAKQRDDDDAREAVNSARSAAVRDKLASITAAGGQELQGRVPFGRGVRSTDSVRVIVETLAEIWR